MPVCTSIPILRNCSATIFDVRNSRLLSSGFWWKSRRQVITCGITAAVAASSDASVTAACAGPAAVATSSNDARNWRWVMIVAPE